MSDWPHLTGKLAPKVIDCLPLACMSAAEIERVKGLLCEIDRMEATTARQVERLISNGRRMGLEEAAVSICGYCRGCRGFDPIPIRNHNYNLGRHHLMTGGNGSNPCNADVIWEMVQREKDKLIIPDAALGGKDGKR